MKARESGMPAESLWDQFFEPDLILKGMGIQNLSGPIVDMGCGYGTFTIPAAQLNPGPIYALDIENDMILATLEKALLAGLKNMCTTEGFYFFGNGFAGGQL